MHVTKIAGIDFDFGGEVLTIPPLALGDLEVLQDRIAALNVAVVDAATIGTVIDATQAALLRNYPDMTRERVSRLIDLGNMGDVIQCVMDVAGLRRKEIATGKAQATPGAPTA